MSAKRLTPKQAAFVAEYLIDLNATQAAIRAGYSQKTAAAIGAENLTKPHIATAIQAAMDERAERTQITADRVLQEIARIGFGDIRRVLSWGRESVHFIPSDELSDDDAATVAEVQAKRTIYTTEDGSEEKIELKMKTHDKLGALRDLGRHLKLFTDKVEHEGELPVIIVRREQ
jgi:phage terminase small subunit